jgi:TPR repeat protein
MSTPNPRYCKLDGLALYAPRRARTHTATVEERWRAKLERIAAAISSVEAIEAERGIGSSTPAPRAPASPTEELHTPHLQSSPAVAADWPALATDEHPLDDDAYTSDQLQQQSSPGETADWSAFAMDEHALGGSADTSDQVQQQPSPGQTADWAALATDECPLETGAAAPDHLQHHLPRDPETRPEPPILIAYSAALPMLIRTSLVVCGTAMATFGLAAILTFPSDGHSRANAGNNFAIAQGAPGVSHGMGATFRGPRQDRIASSLPNDATAASIEALDGGQAALLMQRGRDFLRAGDVTDARLAFQVLADRGNAEAALALATTFDQSSVAMRSAVGAVADDTKARAWYRRAMELGSSEAERALVRMATQ